MTKILIIEDEKSIRTLIRYDLKNLGHEIFESEDGNDGYRKAVNDTFDLILVDWMLPGKSGIEIVSKLRSNGVQAIIIMLTAKDGEDSIISAFDAGVDDYISKPFSPRVLTARINAHLKRMSLQPVNHNFSRDNLAIDFNRREVLVDDELINLTKKEFELLELFISNQGKVLSRDLILNKIWDFDYDGDTRIVDLHIFKLRNKLEKANLEFKANRGVGYILEFNEG